MDELKQPDEYVKFAKMQALMACRSQIASTSPPLQWGSVSL
jgi:hypothetical protein